MESLYQRGWRLAKEGHGVSNLWGNCSKDSEMDEVLRGMEAYWRGQAAPVPPAGDVEVLKTQYRVSAGPMTGWSFWNDGNGDKQSREYYQVQVRELVDRAHVTRLTAERDGLLAEVGHLRQHKNDYMEAAEETRKALHSELTKALEELRLENLAGAAIRQQAEDFKALSWERGQELTKGRELLAYTATTLREPLVVGWEDDLAGKIEAALAHQSAPAAKGDAEDVRAVGEKPVAWLVNGVPFTDAQSAQAFLGFSNYEVVPLYRHAQRPVVLPECPLGYGHGGTWCGPEYNCWLDRRPKVNK